MSEVETIKKIEEKSSPLTITSLKAEFRELGLKPGMTLLLHSSLSSLGWVCGGAVAVILAIEEILGTDGTLVVPTFSTNLSDPSNWHNPPVPESWWAAIRQEMPHYDRDFTPTRGVGVIPETFRKQNGVIRSNHPHISFAAWGKYAQIITDNHTLDYPFGDGSPLARIYGLDGWIVLLGTSYSSNSSFHLAEYRA
ncbi:MAG: AAC(3) family N-acetyltransferase, partial [Dehalococcoidales bacterium]